MIIVIMLNGDEIEKGNIKFIDFIHDVLFDGRVSKEL